MPTSAPLVQSIKTKIPSQIAAGTADAVIAEAPFAATVTSVTLTPDAAITGATATKRTFTVENRGQDGTGTTVIATLDLITGVNPPKHDETAFTLSVVAGATTVAKGDIIACKEVVTSSGTANPGGMVEVEFTRAEATA